MGRYGTLTPLPSRLQVVHRGIFGFGRIASLVAVGSGQVVLERTHGPLSTLATLSFFYSTQLGRGIQLDEFKRKTGKAPAKGNQKDSEAASDAAKKESSAKSNAE